MSTQEGREIVREDGDILDQKLVTVALRRDSEADRSLVGAVPPSMPSQNSSRANHSYGWGGSHFKRNGHRNGQEGKGGERGQHSHTGDQWDRGLGCRLC